MRKVFETLFELVLLVFALNILFEHGQAIWYASSSVRLAEAIKNEWAIAWLPMLIAILVVILMVIFEVWLFRKDEAERVVERTERHDDMQEVKKLY